MLALIRDKVIIKIKGIYHFQPNLEKRSLNTKSGPIHKHLISSKKEGLFPSIM